MDQFDLKDFLKDNKLLKEEKEILNEMDPFTITALIVSFKTWLVANKALIAAVAGVGTITTIVGIFARIVGIRKYFKWMKNKYNMDTDEIFTVFYDYCLSQIPGTKQYDDRDEEANSLFERLGQYQRKLNKNKYTTNNGINVTELLNKLSSNKFYRLGTVFYEKTIKDLEEGIKILNGLLNLMVGDMGHAVIVDKRSLPAMAKKIFDEEQNSFKEQLERLQDALRVTKGRFEEYKELKSVQTLDPKKPLKKK